MRLNYSVVDAFADSVFRGNPAAVVTIDAFLPDDTLRAIAAEFNLSETAFAVPEGEAWNLRWFTPTTEVQLCGHATLATAFVLRRKGVPLPLRFRTLSGELRVEEAEDKLVLDFPAWHSEPAEAPAGLAEALGAAPVEVYKARDWICVFRTPAEVEALKPDHVKIAALDGNRVIATAADDDTCVIATAPGGARADVTSRYFAAKVGIPEDPVTGAAHTQLAPFWSARLGKAKLVCRQASARGGTLWTEVAGDRVKIAGHAVAFAEGVLTIPD